MEYNHDKSIKNFEKEIEIIKNAGFNPIAVSQLYLEDVFVFKTSEEATKAYDLLEDIDDYKIIGWWYGEYNFLKEVMEYENWDGSKVLIHWLNGDVSGGSEKK